MKIKDQLLGQIELMQELYQSLERIEQLESQLKAASTLISSYAEEVAQTRTTSSSQESPLLDSTKSDCIQPNKENALRGRKIE